MARKRMGFMRSTPIVLMLVCVSASVKAAPSFTVVTTESGVQALRDTKPSDWWLSGLSFVDLDHDGDLDLFLADHHGAGLAAINDGKGNFKAAGGSYPTSEVHMCLDVDEDGKVDMDMTYVDGGSSTGSAAARVKTSRWTSATARGTSPRTSCSSLSQRAMPWTRG
jgi:hypothetical protein